MKRVYIAHPLGHGPDREKNLQNAARWVAWAGDMGMSPIAPWIVLASVWDESHREKGLRIDLDQVRICDELWLVGGRISPGMELERQEALKWCEVVDLTHLGYEPPPFEQCKKLLIEAKAYP